MTLKEDFKWFLTEEFNKLREGFKPTDNSEYIKEYCKKFKINILEENLPPSNTTESLPIEVITIDTQRDNFSSKQLVTESEGGLDLNLNESEDKNMLNKVDSPDALSSSDDQNESVNQPKTKCQYCDYEEYPLFLKIHRKNAHPECDV